MLSRSSSVITAQTHTYTAALPKVELKGMHIVVNGKKLSLTHKAKAFRIIRAFFARPSPTLTTNELIQILHDEEGLPRRLSRRAKQCQHSALVRMFSRMREDFEDAFRLLTPERTTWFHYDRDRKHWVLFKMPSTGADGLFY